MAKSGRSSSCRRRQATEYSPTAATVSVPSAASSHLRRPPVTASIAHHASSSKRRLSPGRPPWRLGFARELKSRVAAAALSVLDLDLRPRRPLHARPCTLVVVPATGGASSPTSPALARPTMCSGSRLRHRRCLLSDLSSGYRPPAGPCASPPSSAGKPNPFSSIPWPCISQLCAVQR